MEFIKKNWKKIVTIIFALLFLTMCTKNCSKSNEIRSLEKQKIELSKTIDSIRINGAYDNEVIDSLMNEIKSISIERDIYKRTADDYKNSLNNLSNRNTTIRVNIPETKNNNE